MSCLAFSALRLKKKVQKKKHQTQTIDAIDLCGIYYS